MIIRKGNLLVPTWDRCNEGIITHEQAQAFADSRGYPGWYRYRDKAHEKIKGAYSIGFVEPRSQEQSE